MQQGVDHEESCSPVVEASSLQATVAVAASQGLTLGALDVVNAFEWLRDAVRLTLLHENAR